MDYVVYNGNNYKHFISALFPFLVRLKLKYPNRNIILFNPDISATVFCQLAGISVAFGDISSYLYKTKHETYVFTNDFRMLKLCDKVIRMQGESIVDFTLLEAMSTYHCNLGGIYNFFDKAVKRGRAKQTDLLEVGELPYEYNKSFTVYQNHSNMNIQKLRDLIIAVGISSFASNLERYLRIIHL